MFYLFVSNVSLRTRDDQKPTCKSQASPSTTWNLTTKLRLSGSAASAFTSKTSLQAQDPDFNMKTRSRETQLKTISGGSFLITHPWQKCSRPNLPSDLPPHSAAPHRWTPPAPRSEGAPFHHLKAKQGGSCRSPSILSQSNQQAPGSSPPPPSNPAHKHRQRASLGGSNECMHAGYEGVRADSRPPAS